MQATASRREGLQRTEGLAGTIARGSTCLQADPQMTEAKLVVSSSVYARLLSLADQAPLDGLPLAQRTLERARTLGYNQIGQIHNASASRLIADFGSEQANELLQALFAFGLRPPSAQGNPLDSSG